MKRTHALAATAVGAAVIATGVAVSNGYHSSAPASASRTATMAEAMSGGAAAPRALRVPRGNHLVASLHVLQGVQVYTCSAGVWTFKEPDATMGSTQRPTVLYTAGPEWVSTTDGSAVWGSPLKKVAEPGTIPDLLVKAVKVRGTGLFSRIDYIQRLDTQGGLPPSGHCTDGFQSATPYRATENFWAPDAG